MKMPAFSGKCPQFPGNALAFACKIIEFHLTELRAFPFQENALGGTP